MEKTIEIPFGAKDSELKGWEYTIPENMEAEIKEGKIIVKQKESEDERIRKEIIDYFSQYKEDGIRGVDITPWIAYLERMKYEYEVFEPIENTLEYKAGFKAGIESEKQKEQKPIDYNDELKKCKENSLYFYDKYVKIKMKEQKPAEWSEEDEEKVREIRTYFTICVIPSIDRRVECVNWLKSIHHRYNQNNNK